MLRLYDSPINFSTTNWSKISLYYLISRAQCVPIWCE